MHEIMDTPRGPVIFRELRTSPEMRAAEMIQARVWGADIIPHPKEILIAIQYEGGLLAGAFNSSDEMVSLVFGFPTSEPGVMHSQLLATLPEWRGLGIGTRLKWFQREWCLQHGVALLRWTVDPLRAGNAELNIRHLGCTSTTYLVDFYGSMTGIDAGAPSDRLLLVWDLNSERVKNRAQSTPVDEGFAGIPYAVREIGDRPVLSQLDLPDDRILIQIPEDYARVSREKPQNWLCWREQARTAFQNCFSRGYAVREFTRIGGPAYLVEKRVM